MNFVCSLDIIDDIPKTKIYKLFKENLAKAEMLTYIFVFNASSWVEELNFVWGKKDLRQWNVSTFKYTLICLNDFRELCKLNSIM